MEPKKPNNFDDLKTMGCVTKTLKIGAHEITMRSLGYEEQSQIVANIPDGIKDARKYDLIQKEMLAAAIESIDGTTLPLEEKVKLLGESQTALVNLLFAQYEQLLTAQTEIIEDVKKNISSPEKTR
jgi:hypothetical protein